MFSRYEADPHVIWSVDSSASCSSDDVARRQQAHDLEQQTPGDDDRAVAIDGRVRIGAERHLHVGRGYLEPSSIDTQEDAAQNLDGPARRDGPPNEPENAGELVARAE